MVIMQQAPEITVASLATEHLTDSSRLMEIILERGNMFRALKRVRDNEGAPGVDNMNVNQLPGYLKRHWLKIREELLSGTYKPFPVRRKEISKPGGGVRLLGIPTVLDRLIQQAIAQVIYKLNQYLKGWWNYYRLTEARHLFKSLNGWVIRRLRCFIWEQWKNPITRVRNLLKRGISHKHAVSCGNARKKYWRMSRVKWVIIALPNRYFLNLGLFLPGT